MNHLIPPLPLAVSATISPTIQNATLIATTINVIKSSDLRDSDLSPTDNNCTELESNVVSITESQESSLSVADILNVNNDAEEILIRFDADKIVETIISKTKNPNDNIESDYQKFDNNISDVAIDNTTINVTKNIENDAENSIENSIENYVENSTENSVENSVETFSGDVVLESVSGRRVGSRVRSMSRRELIQLSKFHRIAAVRLEQGISLSSVAKRLRMDIAETRRQEDEKTDLSLSQLYRWREVLEVSTGELVLEPEEIPTNPIKNRCQLVRMMKTVRSIIIESKSEVILVFARQLESQLIELMPELATIAAWPSIGQSRDHRSPGAAATKCHGFGNVYQRRIIPSADDQY
jgi:transcriptional regulator with XRE-family HTH domain